MEEGSASIENKGEIRRETAGKDEHGGKLLTILTVSFGAAAVELDPGCVDASLDCTVVRDALCRVARAKLPAKCLVCTA